MGLSLDCVPVGNRNADLNKCSGLAHAAPYLCPCPSGQAPWHLALRPSHSKEHPPGNESHQMSSHRSLASRSACGHLQVVDCPAPFPQYGTPAPAKAQISSQPRAIIQDKLMEFQGLFQKLPKDLQKDTTTTEEMGMEAQLALNEILEQSEMVATGYCYKHRRPCPYFDIDIPAVRQHGGSIGNICTSTCVAFSSMGSQMRCLADSALPFVCWGMERKRLAASQSEDWLIHECTERHRALAIISGHLPRLSVGSPFALSLSELPP